MDLISLLLSLHMLVAANASTNFADVLRFHEKRQNPQQAASACSLVVDYISSCASQYPGYLTLSRTAQAPCACYNADSITIAWVPNIFDGAVETCASYARNADEVAYQFVQSFSNLCHGVGDLRTVFGSAATACVNINAVVSSCFSKTPDLSTLGVKSSARCFCYDETTWLPDKFDGEVATCVGFAKTVSPSGASPSAISVLQNLAGFCSSVGDVLGPANTPALTTNSAMTETGIFTSVKTIDKITETLSITTSAPTPTLTGYITFPACATVLSAITSCEVASPGFTAAPITSQAACVCYTRSTSWIPNNFDNAVSSCGKFVQTAEPDAYSIYSNLDRFCSSVGDIYDINTSVRITVTKTGSVGAGGGGGGIDANGIIGALSTGAKTTTQTTSTASTFSSPGVVTRASSSSIAGAAPTALVDSWILKFVSVAVVVQAFA